MLGCGMATSFQQLLVWRWVTGIGSALQMTGAQLFLADISTPGNRARSLGLNHSASLLGSLAGPAVGGLLADGAGLNAPFTFTGMPPASWPACLPHHAQLGALSFSLVVGLLATSRQGLVISQLAAAA